MAATATSVEAYLNWLQASTSVTDSSGTTVRRSRTKCAKCEQWLTAKDRKAKKCLKCGAFYNVPEEG